MSNFSEKKYKVLLIRPYFEMIKTELGFLPYEPLGLHYIWSMLLARGHQVDLYDCLAEHSAKTRYIKERDIYRCGGEDKDILERIRKFQPDIVCISGTFFSQASPFFRIAELAKQVSPKIFVIGGGIFPSLYYENTLLESKNLDVIVIGEGEETIAELLDNLDDLSKVKGICYRNKEGKIVSTQARDLKMNLDELPLPHRDFSKIFNYAIHVGYKWSDSFNLKKSLKRFVYYRICFLPVVRNFVAKVFNYLHRKKIGAILMPHAFISSSRGCPNHCSFCSVHKFWKGIYRMRSVENVMSEIDLLVQNGIKEIGIVDENFTVSRERTIKICQAIIDRGYHIRLSSHSGFYLPSMDKEVLEYLYRAGLRILPLAIENADQEFLNKVIKKRVNLEQAKEIVRQANEIGFHTAGYFIFGHPGETKEMMLKTFKYAFESGFREPRFTMLQPFPGTEVYQQAVDDGIIDKNLNIAKLKFSTDTPQIGTKDFTREDVKKIFDLAYKTYRKGNYEEIKDKIREILNW